MPEKERRPVRRTSSSRDGGSISSKPGSVRSKGSSMSPERARSHRSRSRSRSRSHSREPNESTSRPRKELIRSNSNNKIKGRQDDRDAMRNGTRARYLERSPSCNRSTSRERSSKHSKSERSPSRERSSRHDRKERSLSTERSIRKERSRSRERHKGRERSRSTDRNRHQDKNSSSEPSDRRESSKSIDRGTRRERSQSSERSGGRKRSRSRHRSKSRDRSTSHNLNESNGRIRNRSKSRERVSSHNRSPSKKAPSRHRSESKGRSKSRERSTSKSDDTDISVVRRRKMSEDERSKRPSYIRGVTAQKKDKKKSEDRKSNVLGSLNAFLEEDRAATHHVAKDSGDRSVMSSATKIQRRKRSSTPSGSASVYGGQVVTSRDEIRSQRRSRSSSLIPNGDATSVSEQRRESQRERTLSVRSRTPSARTRHSILALERRSIVGDSSVSQSSQRSSQPSDHPPVMEEMPGRIVRKLSLSSGAEVPPGFPVAAIDKNAATIANDSELDGHSSGPMLLESTAKIKERQQRRAQLGERSSSSKSLGAIVDARTMRRKKSLQALAPGVPPPRAISVSQEDSNDAGRGGMMHSSSASVGHIRESGRGVREKLGGQNNLSSRLEKLGTKSSSGRLMRRKSSSDQSVASAPAMSSRHMKPSSFPKMTKGTSIEINPSLPEEMLATFLGMPKDDEDDADETKKANQERSGDSDDVSVASLDPSILNNGNEPLKSIHSIQELYQADRVHDDAPEGIEGELELRDDSTQATQENSTGSYLQLNTTPQVGPSIVMFDSTQLLQGRSIGPGSLSPHSSSLSGTSDSLRSPGVLKRKIGQAKAESPNMNRRVSWVELPMTNPGTLLVKSMDTDGTNQRETEASADVVASVDDLSDEAKLVSAAQSAMEAQNGKKDDKVKKNPSLDSAFENDKHKKKKHPADERTVGTAATNTSEATMKTNNKSEDAISASKLSAPRVHRKVRRSDASENDRPGLARTTSASSLSRSSRSSVRRSTSDGSSSTLSRKSKSSKEDDTSEKKTKKKLTKVASKSKPSSTKDENSDVGSESTKVRRKRSTSMDRSTLDSPNPKREPLRRTKSDAKNPTAKAGSKIKYVSKGERAESQLSGEPTVENSKDNDAGSIAKSLETPSTKKKKSYLNRRNLMKEDKEKSLDAKSSVLNSLDKLLAKIGDENPSDVVDDHRSVYSEGGLKKRKNVLRTRKEESDDRSVTSAPMLNSRRKARRESEKIKVKAASKKVSTWWNLDKKEDD